LRVADWQALKCAMERQCYFKEHGFLDQLISYLASPGDCSPLSRLIVYDQFFLWVLRFKEILGCVVGHSYVICVAVIVIGRLACIIL